MDKILELWGRRFKIHNQIIRAVSVPLFYKRLIYLALRRTSRTLVYSVLSVGLNHSELGGNFDRSAWLNDFNKV